MSLSIQGQKCPACNAYLFEDDDIVFCPECGAPHHRDCYTALGHCALENDHGTDRQYDTSSRISEEEPKEEIPENEAAEEQSPQNEQINQDDKQPYRCMRCGTVLSPEQRSCPRCRTPRIDNQNVTFTPFGPRLYRKWSEDTIVEGDVTLKELTPIVGVNASRYSDKFVTLNKKNKTSWNWAAFFFPAGWAMSRKCFKYGIVFLTVLIAGTLLAIPMRELLSALPIQNATPAEVSSLISNGGIMPSLLYVLSGVLTFGVRIVAALFGDYIYRGECIEKARLIREAVDEKETLYYKLGGVNALWFAVALLAQSYLPTIISAFF